MVAKRNAPWRSGVLAVINKYISAQLMKNLQAFRSAGYCKIIFDGDISDYNSDAAVDYHTTADNLHLKMRVFDLLNINGNITREPDLLINGIQDEKTFLEKCRTLALSPKQTTSAAANVSSLDYIHPFPHDSEKIQ